MTDRGVRHPLVELTVMRFREFVREPEALFWTFGFPVLVTLALGLAFRSDRSQPVSVGVVRGPEAAVTVATLRADPAIAPQELSSADAQTALRDGRVDVIVEPGTPPAYRYDPTRPEGRVARLRVDAVLQRAAGRADVWQARDIEVVAPGSRYVDWLVPGLVGMNIMSTGLWSIGFTVVMARVRKLLKRLSATPMRRGHYLVSHMLARLLFLVLEVVVLVGAARLMFGIPVNGSVALLGAVCVLGALSFGGLGLLIASRVRTVEAVSGLLNVVMLPMWVLSGVFFASSRFPQAMQPLIRALPLTALNEALRAVMIDGARLGGILPQVAVLTLWGAVCFLAALRLFRWA
jgi:ABC-type multidrug transport system permease subunit